MKKRSSLIRYLLVSVLAGLLIAYHCATLIEQFTGAKISQSAAFNTLQAALRTAIILSLSAVLLRVRYGLWGMWLSVSGLIATQYWLHFSGTAFEFTEGRHVLSYLRGFIIPTIINLVIPKHSPD